jgi:RNA-directed DNA polymerase
MHDAIPEQGRWLKAVVTGYLAYHAVPTNARALDAFRYHVIDSGDGRFGAAVRRIGWRMERIAAAWLPPPRILHPWPDERFAVKHPR